MKKNRIAKGFKILISSLIPIFMGPFMIHLGQLKKNYFLIIIGVIICLIAIVLIFTSLFRIINELFEK